MEAIFNVIASALAVVASVLSLIPHLQRPKRPKDDDASRIPTSQTKPDESKDDDASRIPTNSAKLDEP